MSDCQNLPRLHFSATVAKLSGDSLQRFVDSRQWMRADTSTLETGGAAASLVNNSLFLSLSFKPLCEEDE
ncbi:hypothetical protein PanWU01x14_025710, partial [Parasponia andersonii]